jgi:hypothetical protein
MQQEETEGNFLGEFQLYVLLANERKTALIT